jgi:TolB-like protein/Flp pilus assembly protein TadD
LGVLPVKALDSSLMHEFSLGLAEELTTALARFRWISCVSPTSIAALAEEEEISESTRWADLDLDFLVEGSFRQSGPDIQIIVRLINMREPGEISWSKRFDSRFEDVLKLQDQIAADTAAQVAPELLLWGGGQATTRPQVDPSSYELMLRSIPAIYRLDQSGFRAAGPFLKKALQLDPSNAAAHSWLAHWYTSLVGQGWANDTRYAAQQADIHGKRAVLLDPGDARGLTVAGHVRAFLYKQPDPGLELHEQALNLNPNLALAWCYSGLANSYAGHHSEAFEHIRHAQLLSPHDPHGFFFDMALVMPLLLIGDYKTAVQVGRRAREAHPGLSSTYKGLISALGCMGNLGEARTLRQQLALLEPNFSVQEAIKRSPLCRPEDVQCYADGLRLAGCDERARGSPLADCLRPIATRWKQSRWLDEKAG